MLQAVPAIRYCEAAGTPLRLGDLKMSLDADKLRWLSILMLAIALTACGGGGGGGGASTTSLTYTGDTEQAILSETNVEDLAIGSYSGGQIGAMDYYGLSGQANVTLQNVETYQQQRLLSVIETAVRQIEFSHQGNASQAAALANNRVYGSCGGSLSVSFNVNENTGDFSGNYHFDAYCDSGVTLTGSGRMSGN